MAENESENAATAKRRRISQKDIPSVTLAQALRVPRAIAEHYAKGSTRPFDVASALQMSPTAGPFRELCGASIGYGLTDGGPNAPAISLTPLGMRIVAPLEEEDDIAAMREAVLVPSVERQFLEKYDGSPLPADRIAYNVLESMGVPKDATQRVFTLLVENASSVEFIKKIKDKTYVDIGHPAPSTPSVEYDAGEHKEEAEITRPARAETPAPETPATGAPRMANRRVFVSHGSNKRVVEQLKELLRYGDFEPVVAVERETTSKPVPQKVLDDMRSAAAGIIHVSAEENLIDRAGNERRVLNENVLIEIGAAMALYSDRYILLVEDGTTLPSNLQGLYEVRYAGSELGHDGTMRVLKALNGFKSAQG